jgi:hypothetical protein
VLTIALTVLGEIVLYKLFLSHTNISLKNKEARSSIDILKSTVVVGSTGKPMKHLITILHDV